MQHLKPILQRLPGVWLLLVLPLAVLGPVKTPLLYACYYIALHLLFLLNNSRSAYGMYVAYNSAKMHSVTDWEKKYMEATGTASPEDPRHDLPYNRVLHVLILPNYKEDMDTLCETLDVLASHNRALTQYRVCLAMEESEQGSEEKAKRLISLYQDAFYEVVFTIHPIGRPGEIRGKSSNVAWAAQQMASRFSGGLSGRHEHEILTVMDADTCFAEDYFTAVAFHYTTASPEQRKLMMFAPSTVFDRNSNNVPVFVRVTDMFWSIGVISNLYYSSPVKLPCSAYSVSMDLAIAVNFWDAGPEAIGEDLHMYLKCFFATRGHVIVKSIFSPASQCNIEGSGSGISGWISGIQARYTQAKRHLWGSLDTGYTIRRSLTGILYPEREPVVNMKNASVDKLGKTHDVRFEGYTLFTLFHRLLEAHILMGHLFVMITIGAFLFPTSSSLSYELSAFLWGQLSDDPVPKAVEFAIQLSFWLRIICLIPNVLMIYFYENYLRWTGFERWALQEKTLKQQHTFTKDAEKYLGDLRHTHARFLQIQPQNAHLKVQHLGKRASLAAGRMYPRSLLDWFTIPIAGFLFYVMPQFHAQLAHLVTDSLEYKVAAKPQLVKREFRVEEDVKSVSSKGDEGYFEDEESPISIRVD